MIVFTDNEDRIIAYDSTDKEYKNKIDIGNYFDNKCDEYIFGYKCVPTYQMEVDDNLMPKLDEHGDIIYSVDEHGNKIISGFSTYPFLPYLEVAQRSYEQMILTLAEVIGGAYE